ncbi:MAG: hypothetical protein COA79_09660 [Planctomycetota bacterium]|nr:MAG: hypothetical protein COA79_09660 [Planctomycetota bacterium]
MKLTIPEKAIQIFENWSQTIVTIHDISHDLVFFLPTNRLRHSHQFCSAVKNTVLNKNCLKFEIDQLRNEIIHYPEGRTHICHAGLVECVYPVLEKGKLKWVFFAGPKFPTNKIIVDKKLKSSKAIDITKKWNLKKNQLKDQFELDSIMEGLRQLAARIQIWHQEFLKSNSSIKVNRSRKDVLLHFLNQNYKRQIYLSDLAKNLNISDSRAAHVTKEILGETFIAILQNIRLRCACSLLQNTDLKIEQIAVESGFQDVSYFYKVFQIKFKTSPGKFRKLSN